MPILDPNNRSHDLETIFFASVVLGAENYDKNSIFNLNDKDLRIPYTFKEFVTYINKICRNPSKYDAALQDPDIANIACSTDMATIARLHDKEQKFLENLFNYMVPSTAKEADESEKKEWDTTADDVPFNENSLQSEYSEDYDTFRCLETWTSNNMPQIFSESKQNRFRDDKVFGSKFYVEIDQSTLEFTRNRVINQLNKRLCIPKAIVEALDPHIALVKYYVMDFEPSTEINDNFSKFKEYCDLACSTFYPIMKNKTHYRGTALQKIDDSYNKACNERKCKLPEENTYNPKFLEKRISEIVVSKKRK